MTLKISFQKASKKFHLYFFFITSLFTFKNLSAQNEADSTKKPLLASLNNKTGSRFVITKSNVIFPEILKGNEEEMLPYIEKFSNKKRGYLVSMYTKGKSFLPKAASILKKFDLPEELNILLALESEYNGDAVSRSGAVGYWQIMDEMARDYGMKFNAKGSGAEKKKLLKLKGKKGEYQHRATVKIKDERKNFNIATQAAARYLSDRRKKLNDNWLLVVASYNCGEGNVRKAIKRCGKINPSFWDLKNYLPAETRAYVLNFITLNVIFNNYEMFASNKLKFATEKVMLPEGLQNSAAEAMVGFSAL